MEIAFSYTLECTLPRKTFVDHSVFAGFRKSAGEGDSDTGARPHKQREPSLFCVMYFVLEIGSESDLKQGRYSFSSDPFPPSLP